MRRSPWALTERLTYANVTATLALFLALGGVSIAAVKALPKGSVGTPQIKNHAITTRKLHAGAVTAATVKANSLTGTQINESQLGEVPAAARADTAASADAIGGVGLAGLLRSDHVLTGHTDAVSAGVPVLSDPRTGVEVLTGESGALRILNTNGSDPITVDGLGYAVPGEITGTQTLLSPGAHVDIRYSAVFFGWGQYTIVRQPGGVSLQLTCSRRFNGSTEVLSCIGVG